MVLVFIIACCVFLVSLLGVLEMVEEFHEQVEHELLLDELWDDDDDLAVSA